MFARSATTAEHVAPRHVRRVIAAVSAATATSAGIVAMLAGSTGIALATSSQPSINFSTPGSYSLTIPAAASGFSLTIAGADGNSGTSDSAFGNRPGAGGRGAQITAEIKVAAGTDYYPGETLTVVVGGHEIGGTGGAGSLAGGAGGTGGAPSVIMSDTGKVLAVAGGGGGGGGAGGAFYGYDGGGGGNAAGSGGPGVTGFGGASGGAAGSSTNCPVGRIIEAGHPGNDAPTSSSAGGGGGAGGGYCSGGSGDAGTAGGGGSGGGGGGNLAPSGNVFVQPIGQNNTANDGFVFTTFSVDDVAPSFLPATAAATIASGDASFSYQVHAYGQPDPTYSLQGAPSWLSIDPVSGLISGNSFRPSASGNYSFQVVATNASGSASLQFSLTVAAPPNIDSPNSAQATVGSVFSFNAHAASYPVASYSLAGAPPSWLAIDPSTGVMTGTPPKGSEGVAHFYVLAANGVDASTNQYFTLTVQAAPILPLTILGNSNALDAAAAGSPYSNQLSGSGGVDPYSWSLTGGALPAGLTLGADGSISGTPAAATGSTSSTFTVTLADSQNPAATVSRQFTLSVAAPTPPAAAADLAISLNHVGSFKTGQTATYHVRLSNTGTATASGTRTLTLSLPTGTAYLRTVASGWHCAATGQLVTCTPSMALRVAQHVDASITVRVKAAAGTHLTATASVATTDATPGDNSSSDVVTVRSH